MPTVRGPVRARDLRASIKELGFEQATVTTLEYLLEERAEYRQHMREMAEMLNKCIDAVGVMQEVGNSVTQKLEQLKRDMDRGEHLDDS